MSVSVSSGKSARISSFVMPRPGLRAEWGENGSSPARLDGKAVANWPSGLAGSRRPIGSLDGVRNQDQVGEPPAAINGPQGPTRPLSNIYPRWNSLSDSLSSQGPNAPIGPPDSSEKQFNGQAVQARNPAVRGASPPLACIRSTRRNARGGHERPRRRGQACAGDDPRGTRLGHTDSRARAGAASGIRGRERLARGLTYGRAHWQQGHRD